MMKGFRTCFQPISDQGDVFLSGRRASQDSTRAVITRRTTQTHKHTLTQQRSPVLSSRPVTRSTWANPRPGAISSSSPTRSASQGPEPGSGSGERCSLETTGSPWSRRSAWSSRTPREAETCPRDTADGREREKGPEHLQCGHSGKVSESLHQSYSNAQYKYTTCTKKQNNLFVSAFFLSKHMLQAAIFMCCAKRGITAGKFWMQ